MPLKVFGVGAVSWLSAIIAKLVMDLTITPTLFSSTGGYSALALAISLGIYLGLRSGIFENGLSFIWAKRMRLKGASYDEVIAFGLGFAGIEAFFLGISSFLNIFVLVSNPNLFGTLTPETQQALSQQFALGPLLIGAPLIERLAVLFIHVFSTVLVFKTINEGTSTYIIMAILYKTAVDGLVPILNLLVSTPTLFGIYMIEVPFVLLGILGWVGLIRYKETYTSTIKSNDNEHFNTK